MLLSLLVQAGQTGLRGGLLLALTLCVPVLSSQDEALPSTPAQAPAPVAQAPDTDGAGASAAPAEAAPESTAAQPQAKDNINPASTPADAVEAVLPEEEPLPERPLEALLQAYYAGDWARFEALSAALEAVPLEDIERAAIRFYREAARLNTGDDDSWAYEALAERLPDVEALPPEEDLTPLLLAERSVLRGRQLAILIRRGDRPPELQREANDHLTAALEQLAQAPDTPLHRQAYLDVLERLRVSSTVLHEPAGWPYLWDALRLPLDADERARWSFRALRIGQERGILSPGQQMRLLQQALAGPEEAPWRMDVLWLAAQAAETGERLVDPRGPAASALAQAADYYRQMLALDGAAERRAQAQARLEALEARALELEVRHQFLPQGAVVVHLKARNCPTVDLRLFRLPDLAAFRSWEAVALDASTLGTPLWEAPEHALPDAPYALVEAELRPDVELEPGLYLLSARHAGVEARALLSVSEWLSIQAVHGSEALLYLGHGEDGSPIAGAQLHAWSNPPAQGAERTLLGEATTNAAGWARLPLELTEAVAVTAQREGQPPEFLATLNPGPATAAGPPLLWQADRASLTAGDRWSWCLVWAQPLPAGLSATLTGPSGNVAEYRLPEGERSWAASWRSSLEDRPGTYALTLWREAAAARPEARQALWRGVLGPLTPPQQEHLRLSLRIAGDEASTRDLPAASDGLALELFARSALGRRLEGLRFDVRVWRMPLAQGSAEATLLERAETPLPQRPPELVRALETDARGRARLTLPAPEVPSGQSLLYQFHVVARDGSGMRAELQEALILGPAAHRADLTVEQRLVREGETATVSISTQSHLGRTTPQSGTLRLFRQQWQQTWVHRRRGIEISGEEYRRLPNRSLLGPARGDYYLKDEGFRTEAVATLGLETDFRGQVTHRYMALPPGYYRALWESDDRAGRRVSASGDFWVFSPDLALNDYRAEALALLAEPAGAEAARLLVATDVPGRQVLLLRGPSEETSDAEVELLPLEGTALLKPYARQSPDVTHAAALVAEGSVHTALAARPDASDQRLTLEAELEGGATHPPGTQAQLRVRIREAGQPAEAMLLTWAEPLRLTARPAPGGHNPGHAPKSLVLTGSDAERPLFRPTLERDPSVTHTENALLAQPLFSRLELPDRRGIFRAHESPAWTAWTGPLAAAEGTASLDFTLPQRRGSWRIQLLAWSGEAVARTELFLATNEPVSVQVDAPERIFLGDVPELHLQWQNYLGRPLEAAALLRLRGAPTTPPIVREVEPFELPDGASSTRLPLRVESAGTRAWELAVEHRAGQLASTGTLEVDDPHAPVRKAHWRLATSQRLAWELPELPAQSDPRLQVSAGPRNLLRTLTERLNTRPESQPHAQAALLLLEQMLRGLLAAHNRASPDDMAPLRDSRQRLLTELRQWQRPDGGWGWVDGAPSDTVLTAWITWVLQRLDTPDTWRALLRPAQSRLESVLRQREATRREQVWALLALASRFRQTESAGPTRLEARTLIELLQERASLTPEEAALLRLAAQFYAFWEDAAILAPAAANTPRQSLAGASAQVLALLHAQQPAETVARALGQLSRLQDSVPPFEDVIGTTLSAWALHEAFLSHGGGRGSVEVQEVLVDGHPLTAPAPGFGSSADGWALPAQRSGVVLPLEVATASTRPGWWMATLTAADETQPREADPGVLKLQRHYERVFRQPTLLREPRQLTVAWEGQAPFALDETVEVVLRLETTQRLTRLSLTDGLPRGFRLAEGTGFALVRADQPAAEPGPQTDLPDLHGEVTQSGPRIYIGLLPPGVWDIRYRIRAIHTGVYQAPPARIRQLRPGGASSTSASHTLTIHEVQR